jgi:uncharacterized protein
MPSPMYMNCVPVFRQLLGAMKTILAQAREHATARSIDPGALLQAPLYPDMFPLLQQTLGLLDSIDAARFEGRETAEIVLRPGTPKEKRLTGQVYLSNYGLPQFLFHATTAYAILRHNGLPIGKRDFMGAY